MKIYILLLFSFIVNANTFAHKFYIGLAEVQYNSETSVFEATLIFCTHDMELKMLEDGINKGKLDQLNEIEFKLLENTINKHFTIFSNGKLIELHLEHFENKLDGNTNFYLSSSKVENPTNLEFKLDLLFKEFPEQQNKLSYISKNKTHALVFLQNKPTAKLETI